MLSQLSLSSDMLYSSLVHFIFFFDVVCNPPDSSDNLTMGLDSQHEKHHSFSFLYTHGPADGQGHSRFSDNKRKVYSLADDQISFFLFFFFEAKHK